MMPRALKGPLLAGIVTRFQSNGRYLATKTSRLRVVSVTTDMVAVVQSVGRWQRKRGAILQRRPHDTTTAMPLVNSVITITHHHLPATMQLLLLQKKNHAKQAVHLQVLLDRQASTADTATAIAILLPPPATTTTKISPTKRAERNIRTTIQATNTDKTDGTGIVAINLATTVMLLLRTIRTTVIIGILQSMTGVLMNAPRRLTVNITRPAPTGDAVTPAPKAVKDTTTPIEHHQGLQVPPASTLTTAVPPDQAADRIAAMMSYTQKREINLLSVIDITQEGAAECRERMSRIAVATGVTACVLTNTTAATTTAAKLTALILRIKVAPL